VNKRNVAVRGVALAAAASAVLLTPTAGAAQQYPSSQVPGDSGMRIDWSGRYVSTQRVEDITLQLCDASPADKNQASLRLEAWVTNGGTYEIKVSPSLFQVPQSDAKCKEWRKVFLTYLEDGDRIAYIRAKIYGSSNPSNAGFSKWVRNPYVNP
jgi:hypothetical protein